MLEAQTFILHSCDCHLGVCHHSKQKLTTYSSVSSRRYRYLNFSLSIFQAAHSYNLSDEMLSSSEAHEYVWLKYPRLFTELSQSVRLIYKVFTYISSKCNFSNLTFNIHNLRDETPKAFHSFNVTLIETKAYLFLIILIFYSVTAILYVGWNTEGISLFQSLSLNESNAYQLISI